ncbi:MAG: 16S rRNA (cytidine(1402)-2'-O)-methyltransferase [Chloroflexota bacterium]
MTTLYLVGTPIGNLGDMSPRAIEVMRQVPLIAAEDSRVTGKLLNHFEIQTRITSFHEHNEVQKTKDLLNYLQNDDLALVSDAGMPGLSDPGYRLVRAAIADGVKVVPVPGPSAPIAALVASGMPVHQFTFLGYLPRRSKARGELLKRVAAEARTAIAFESPHRLRASLEDIDRVLPKTQVVIARELTKLHEEFLRGTANELLEMIQARKLKGEITLVIGASEKQDHQEWTEDKIQTLILEHLANGLGTAETARLVAAESGMARRELYQLVAELQQRTKQ